jgi:hypothetical protein
MTFATPALRTSCEDSKAVLEKLTTIKYNAPNYGTPGPGNFGAAKHAHITNKIGIAWTYTLNPQTGQYDVHIHALGEKHNRNTGRGDSGYDWDANGNVALNV